MKKILLFQWWPQPVYLQQMQVLRKVKAVFI
ncbi:Uncharacterised protein [Klebsiella pneumoniae]|nr:Uncharacterised protein [Klebsiella pneumoniae]